MEILGGEDDGYWGYQQLRSRGNTIEAGTSRDPAQHHRRAGARPPEVALMQFAFTADQELLRREARDVLINGGWGHDEPGRPSSASSTARSSSRRPGARIAARSSSTRSAPEDRSGWRPSRWRPRDRVAGARARRGVRAGPGAVRPQDRRLPGGLPPAGEHVVEAELARSLAYWAAWCVAENDEGTHRSRSPRRSATPATPPSPRASA